MTTTARAGSPAAAPPPRPARPRRWPVIDATFRYSIFLYGALTAHAPQYSGFLGGLQVSDTTPFS